MTERRNVYGMDFTMERDTEGAKALRTLAEVLGYGAYDEFENNTFKYTPFNYNIDGGEDEICRPLFIHKKTGFKMYWYKYPLRYAYCNIENITSDFLKDIVEDCVKSLSEKQQTEYYDMIVYSKFREHLNIPKCKISKEPYMIEEYINNRDGKLIELFQRNNLNSILLKTTFNDDETINEVFNYRLGEYEFYKYEKTDIGMISKRYVTSLDKDSKYDTSKSVLDKRVITQNKDCMEIKVKTNYYRLYDNRTTEDTTVIIKYDGSNDYTLIEDDIRETYIHDDKGNLKQLIVTDIDGHKNTHDVDIIKHTDGTTYYFYNGNFSAFKKDSLGRIILNINSSIATKIIYDGDSDIIKTIIYYDTIVDSKLYNNNNVMRKLTNNSFYGEIFNGWEE